MAKAPRSPFEIKMEMLDYIFKHKGEPITHVMYSVNLSWAKTTEVLNQLIKSKCVEKKQFKYGSTRDKFNITMKGTHALKHHKIAMGELK